MSLPRFAIAAAATALTLPLTAQQLDTAQLVLNYSAALDPLGDTSWNNDVNDTNNLTFASAPTRSVISSADYKAIVAGYTDGATGLDSFFDQGSPIRSTADATFELWINVTTLTGGNDQIIFEAGGGTRGMSFTMNGSQLRFNVKGDATTVSTITRTLTVGVHHLVGVIRCTNDATANDSIVLFHNGTQVQILNSLQINDWSGTNVSGLGKVASTAIGVTTPIDFSGVIASLRYYQGRAFTSAQAVAARDFYKDRISTAVTGRTTSANYATTSIASTAFVPTKVQLVSGTYWGLDFNESDGTDGLVVGQFVSLDVYSSTNGKDWTFVRTGISRTDHPELMDAAFRSRQFVQTPNGKWAFYAKHHYAASPRKNLACFHADTIGGPYRLAFTVQPFGYSSGDLGLYKEGANVYIISAATNEGDINIFKTNAEGDALAELTKNLHWNLSTGVEDHREAPSLFFRDGFYYLTTSGKTGWKPNQQKYTSSTALNGTWSALVNYGDETGYHSQLFAASGISGTAESNKIFASTRNAPQWGNTGGSRSVRLPMRFNTRVGQPASVPDEMTVNYYDYTIVNETTGTVEGYHYDHGQQLAVTNVFVPGSTESLAALIDGNEATIWNNANNASKKEIRWDLGSAKLVKALKLMPIEPLKWSMVVNIYVGDGTNWTQVFPTADAPPVIPMMAFPAPLDVTDATGRYVRMVLVENRNAEETTPGMINTMGFHETEIWGGTSSAGLEVNQTFTGQADNAAPTGWTINAGGGSVKIAPVPSATDKSIKLIDTSATAQTQATLVFTKQKGSMVVFETDYRADNAASGEYIRLLQGTTIAFEFSNGANGLNFLDRSGTYIPVNALTTGVWHHIRLELNTDLDTFDLYYDNKLVWSGGKLRNDVNGIDKLVFGTSNPANTVSSYLDDVTIDGPMP